MALRRFRWISPWLWLEIGPLLKNRIPFTHLLWKLEQCAYHLLHLPKCSCSLAQGLEMSP